MPGKDGTGPVGQGPVKGKGRARGRSGFGRGPSENCVCPNCGEVLPHKRGEACSQVQCPKCGDQMVRE